MSTVVHSDPGPSSPRPHRTTSIPPDDYHVPCPEPSEFLQVLVAPYSPPMEKPPLHRAQPRPDHTARCRATIKWTPTPPTTSSSHLPAPPSELDQPIYRPHGRWAWTDGLSINDPKQLLPLRNGAQCSASIDSGTIDGRDIKYICRRWKASKQKEWYGFHSELTLYNSEQYLRPLQGDVVPHIIGVHVMPEAVSVTMEMPHSSFWIESSPTMPDILKERVIAAFEKIHAQGVLHGDPELRHMLIGADGKVMIIDFGMSRAIREHASVGIERAEPEEFRLELRKVKYKLDYMGARKKEGDKVDEYLRRVRKNRKISELWKRRAKGERVGPIPQYEEDPEEYELDPPVNAQDFQEDWITASDDMPMRVVVPGQTPEEVATQVQVLLSTMEGMYSASCTLPITEALCTSPTGYGHPPTPLSSHQENVNDVCLPQPPPRQLRSCHVKDENDAQSCRNRMIRRLKRHRMKRSSSPPLRNEDELFPLSAKHIEGTSIRREYIRHKQMKSTFISSLSNNPGTAVTFPSSIDVLKEPRSLRADEYRRIEESRRQAIAQYSRAPKGILKRRRDDEEEPDTGTPVSKKLRFLEQMIRPPSRGRTPFLDSASGRRPRVIMHSRAHKRLRVPNACPELVDFTLPSLKTLSTLVGSLMPWVHCR